MKAFYASLKQTSIITLIDDPQAYFGNETQIIYVRAADDEDKNNDDNRNTISELLYNPQESYLEAGNNLAVKSGVRIAINTDWTYIPYNINYDQRKKVLGCLFKIVGLDITAFINDIKYGIQNRQKIKEIYDLLEGGINVNSMLLYSGPAQNKNDIFSFNVYPDWYGRRCCSSCPEEHLKIAACIFTGDTDFNVVDIKTIFKDYWKSVGTIQLPHHGSEKSFNVSLFDDNRGRIFPVSYGTTNKYGHPSDNVITEIISRGSCVVDVNEDEKTIYTQTIKAEAFRPYF